MTTRFRKNRKKRGHVSAGHGRIGRHALLPPPSQQFLLPAVNVDRLWSLVPEAVANAAAKDGATAPSIDVTQFGYFKVLGKGMLPPDRPVVVKAKLVSKIAEKKIKAAGGAVVLTA
ncbi:60S ribosomal protein [Musa troglodytarum]|uniref:60S ribosomal protein n=1 Tax=Musa troglodytarum TaxID=320322 RepID=A0A9E7EUW9_9LILI|nr:60S ribosomal protein [Musa troglodytarum]